jgi:osmotically-inducible protein OsmY
MLVFFAVVFAFMLAVSCCFAAVVHTAAPPQPNPKATPTKPQSDADIQKCIQDKLAASELKNQNVQVSVANGEATLSGSLSTPAHKNTAGQIARGCGAHKYTIRKITR